MWYTQNMTDSFDFLKTENIGKYKEFYDFLILNNKKFNLTSIVDYEEFLIKHVVDSLSCKNIFKDFSTVIEIGSGAGFPSVPLKKERNDLKFTLIESNEKKCEFLKEVAEKFLFNDFSVICGRAEELSLKEEYREKFDYSIARAVAPLNVLCELLIPFVKVGGSMIALKGSKFEDEIIKARSAIEKLGGELDEIKKYSLPNEMGDRAIIIIKKITNTQNCYPRRYSKIKKCPL